MSPETQRATAKLNQFHQVTVAHPRLAAVKDRLMSAILDGAPGSLILVIGPTGVGKTTLRLKAEQLIAQNMQPVVDEDPGRMPYVSIEAVAPENGNFSWRDHFYRLLEEMKEPLIDHKMKPGQLHFDHYELARLAWAAHPSAISLRHALEQALKHRNPAVVFTDEAQHLARMASGRRLSDQLDVIKSIANRTGIVHVLLGTYDLLTFCDLSGQLSRRSVYVHFRRYLAEEPDDVEIFQNVLLTFQGRLPLPVGADLMADWEFFYERSAGCVGVLKEWLERAAAEAIKRGGPSVEREDLTATALSASQCAKIVVESREGESRLTDTEESRSRLRLLMRLGSPRVGADRKPDVSKGEMVQQRKPKNKQRAGRRRPQRDRIGTSTLYASQASPI